MFRFACIRQFVHMPDAHKAVTRAVEIRTKQIFQQGDGGICVCLYVWVQSRNAKLNKHIRIVHMVMCTCLFMLTMPNSCR